MNTKTKILALPKEIIVSPDKTWIAETALIGGKETVVTLQPIGGNFSIFFWEDFKAFKEFINGLPDGT